MGRVLIPTLAITLLVGCNSQGLIPPENPSQKTHQVNLTSSSVEESGAFAEWTLKRYSHCYFIDAIAPCITHLL